MMLPVRVSVKTDFRPLDRQLRLVEQWPYEVGEAVFDEVVDDAYAFIDTELVQNPPPFTGKHDWQTPLQRKAYFASGGFGRGIPTVRTGAMNDAWDVGYRVERGAISVTLTNTSGHFRYVVGGLRLSDPLTMQRMHIQGGWQPVAPRIDAFIPVFRAKAVRAIRRIPAQFV